MSFLPQTPSQAAHYQEATDAYGAEISRFAAGYERDMHRRQELLQEVHLALWQSFSSYRAQCSLRTWAYRVATNVCVSHVQRDRRLSKETTELEVLTAAIDERADISLVDREIDLSTIMDIIHSLKPLDRQVMLLYLEDLDADAIGEVTGFSARNVATKIHRLKALVAARLEVRRNML